jgi:carboxymethylenebutenolidase
VPGTVARMGLDVATNEITIDTGEGSMGTFVAHPSDGGPHPLVVFLMDAPGKRPLLHDMAARLASHGYSVMLPNLYYRTTPHFELDFSSRESFERMRELMGAIGNNMVMRDVTAIIGHATDDPRTTTDDIGVVGYCMSGPFALFAASQFPDRVRAAASFYGVRLVTDRPDSPHAHLRDVTGEIYVACAEHDDYVPLSMVDEFEAAMQTSGVHGRLERFWGMHHGFAFTDRPQHDADGERRHWDALLDLFARTLGGAPAPEDDPAG